VNQARLQPEPAGNGWRAWGGLLTCGLIVFGAGTAARGQALDPLVADGFGWTMTAEEFGRDWLPRGFEWVSVAKNAARNAGLHHAVDPARKAVVEVRPSIGGMPVGETLVHFREGVVGRIDISVYNRGDNAPLDDAAFASRVAAVKALVTKIAGQAGMDEGRDNRSASRAHATRWNGTTSDYKLEVSFQRAIRNRQAFVGEFIRLRLEPSARSRPLLDNVAARENTGPKDREALLRGVARKPNGDVVIETVPMVDQGDRGYCAVAAAERVFRYYGLDVDQHAMAQLSGSSASGGTSPDAMVEALQDAAGRLKVHVRTHAAIEDYESFEKMVKSYNRVAKKNGAKEIPVREGAYLNMLACYMVFDAASLRETKLKGGDFERFRKLVREQIDAGVPLLWSLFLGIYPEDDIPQRSGGHMRLIIGYNDTTGEILYSDSWGAGHEQKRMGVEEAYTMTTGLRTLQPFR